jgi:hypothetical protein
MKDTNIILATDENGNDITVRQVEEWLAQSNRNELSSFFYHRFYGRFLRPLDFQNDEYNKKYKSGFAIMVNSCLLIETFVSFMEPEFLDTNYKSERCFGYFFNVNPFFNQFAKNSLDISAYKDIETKLKNKGIPKDFYNNVRCGLLHNAETRNGWKIVRSGNLFDESTKKINADLFMENLKKVLEQYSNKLLVSDFDNDKIWINYKKRVAELIRKSQTDFI